MVDAITDWAIKHNISAVAVAELRGLLDPLVPSGRGNLSHNETDVSTALAIEAGKRGVPLWRNNNGAFQDSSRRWIFFGLGNISTRVNKVMKSSDRIGINPIKIGPEHMGRIIGQFVAVEAKRPGWTKPENDRDRAQEHFMQIVKNYGGAAGFANKPGDLEGILKNG